MELVPADLLPRPEIFSQHEVSEIAGDPHFARPSLSGFVSSTATGCARLKIWPTTHDQSPVDSRHR